MRAVIQRVGHAKVEVDGETTGAIKSGLMVLLGITHDDDQKDIEWLVKKIINLRIFYDDDGVKNVSILETGGDILVVSQFTLFADTRKGNRPSYMRSAHPDISIPLYEDFLSQLRSQFKGSVETGKFGAMMEVSLLNSGPVTIILDSKNPSI